MRILLRPQDVQGVRLEPGDEDHEVYVSQGRIWGKETYLQLWEAWQVVRQPHEATPSGGRENYLVTDPEVRARRVLHESNE